MKVRVGDILEATRDVSTTKGEFTLEEGSSDIVEDVIIKGYKQYFWFKDHPGVFEYKGFEILNRSDYELKKGVVITEDLIDAWCSAGYNSSSDKGNEWIKKNWNFSGGGGIRYVEYVDDTALTPLFHLSGCGEGLVLKLDGFVEFWEELSNRGEVKSIKEMNHDTGITV